MIIDKKLINHYGPLIVKDADGDEINNIVHADTETGIVVQLRTDKHGLFVHRKDNFKVDTVERVYPAPLKARTIYGDKKIA